MGDMTGDVTFEELLPVPIISPASTAGLDAQERVKSREVVWELWLMLVGDVVAAVRPRAVR